MSAITTTPASMASVLRNSRAPKIIQPSPHGTAASISTPTRMRQACAEAEPQAGQDVGQRAGQDDMAEQAAVVGAHRLRRAQPDFLHRLHAGPGVEDDREHRDEGDQQHGGDVAEPEPQQEQRRIGEAGDRRADADQRQRRCPRPGASGPSGCRWSRRRWRRAKSPPAAAARCRARDAAGCRRRVRSTKAAATVVQRRKQLARKHAGPRHDLPQRAHHEERKGVARDRAQPLAGAALRRAAKRRW